MHYQSSVFFNFAYEISGGIYQSYSNTLNYFRLEEVNDSLQKANSRLYNKMRSSWYGVSSGAENTGEDTAIVKKKYRFIPVKVINNSVTRRNNYLTLNKGRLHGIKEQMGVISANGIVGIVKQVSPHFSVVISVLHRDFRVSARIRETGYVGSLLWDGRDPGIALLKDVPMNANVKEGQVVSISPYSVIFPKDIPIGKISDYEIEKGGNFYTIYVKLNTNFHKLTRVQIVKNTMHREQINLEKEARER